MGPILVKKRHAKRANFNRVFPKLHIEHLSGLCREPFNCSQNFIDPVTNAFSTVKKLNWNLFFLAVGLEVTILNN